MTKLLASLVLVFALIALACAQNASDLVSVSYEPVFQDLRYPFRVTIQNDGPDLDGIMTVESEANLMNYRVQVPHGGQKRWTICLGDVFPFATAKIHIDTNHYSANLNYSPPVANRSFGNWFVGMVTDGSGSMQFIRGRERKNPAATTKETSKQTVLDLYARAEAWPDRLSGIESLRVIVLGPGSERLADDQIRAMKAWLLVGGTLIFPGGASSPVLRDPRWQDVLPVTNPRNEQVSTLSIPAAMRNQLPAGPFAVVRAQAQPGAQTVKQGDLVLTATRQVGMGKCLFIAFNPFESQFKQWDGRADYTMSVIERSLGTKSASVDASTAPTSYVYVDNELDPFHIELPSSQVMLVIMLAYLVCVVPINLLVLRKLKRGELAWITTPIISVAFASLFFMYASRLYSAQSSVSLSGSLIMDPRLSEGIFSGEARMFFSTGGTYDLKFSGVESVSPMQSDPWARSRTEGMTAVAMQPFDDGEVTAPSMTVRNLSFHEFAFKQRVSTKGWFDVSWRPTKAKDGQMAIHLRLVNRSPFRLGPGSLSTNSYGIVSLPGVNPGATVESDFVIERSRRLPPIDWSTVNIRIIAELMDFRAGPQLGKIVESSSPLLIVIAPLPREMS